MNRTNELYLLVNIKSNQPQLRSQNIFICAANALHTNIKNTLRNNKNININNLLVEYNKLKNILCNQYVVSNQQREHYNNIMLSLNASLELVKHKCRERDKREQHIQQRLSLYGFSGVRKRNVSHTEKTVTELGDMYKRLSEVVAHQSNIISDIESNMDTGYTNTLDAQSYISMLPKSQYMLIIKTYVLLILFIIFFMVYTSPNSSASRSSG